MSQTYNDESIDQLVGATRIRKRPASMLGSSGVAGARHGFIEMYGNALDEHTAGYGNRLDVTYYKDGSVSIRDYGRGVPLGWNNKPNVQNWNWHVIYNELYGGGKYATYQEELAAITDWSKFDATQFNYLFSVGLNGLGAASTQYTSEFFVVKSYSGGKCKSRSFKRGIPIVNGEPFDMFTASQVEIQNIPEEIEDTDEPDGTFVYWKPDDTVFDDVNIGSDWLLETCKDVAGIAGVEFNFKDEITGKEVHIDSATISDVVERHAGNSLVYADTDSPVIFTASSFDHGITKVNGEGQIWVCQCDVAIGITKSETSNACYHNAVKMLSGVQYEGAQDAITAFLNERGRAAGVKITPRDYDGVVNIVVRTYSNIASFRNQTKDAVDDLFIYSIVKKTILSKLQVEYGKNNKYVVGMVNRVIEEAQSRIEAQALQDLERKTNKIKREKTPGKFVTCDAYEDKNYEAVELWITEGDSANDSVKSARNKKFQALFPIRGKGLNVTKASDKRILNNVEIRNLFTVLGTGFDLRAKGAKFFNINDLKVGKIIIATDADEDGYQIRVLMFLTFYKLAPQLLLDGRVYIAETPRFCLYLSDGTRIYARNDAERDECMKKYAGRITQISRYKGLGEVNPDILRESTVHPDTRNLIQLTCDFNNQTECDMIDALFGADKYGQRKAIISEVLGSDIAKTMNENALIIGEIDEEEMEDGVEVEEVVL